MEAREEAAVLEQFGGVLAPAVVMGIFAVQVLETQLLLRPAVEV